MRTELIIEGYADANVLTPADSLAFKNLCRCSESLTLGKYIFTKTQIPVNEYHKNKIQEIAS